MPVLNELGVWQYSSLERLVAISIAHVSHGLSVLALFGLTRAIFPDRSNKLAFVTACLHIFSPAGIFLSAAYGESTFALFNFLGYLLFAKSFSTAGYGTSFQDASLTFSGILFGLATTIRSNGLLNGLMFLEEMLRIIFSLRDGLHFSPIRRLVAVGFGGMCIGGGLLLPQYIAYQEFCGTHAASHIDPPRVWCERILPSIFTFVQGYYWYTPPFLSIQA